MRTQIYKQNNVLQANPDTLLYPSVVVTQQERVKFDEEKDSKKLGDEGGGGGGVGAESTLAQTFIICQVLQRRTGSCVASVVDVRWNAVSKRGF